MTPTEADALERSGLEARATKAKVLGSVHGRASEILTPEALDFLAGLHRAFDARRRELLAARVTRQERFDAGETPDFLPETADVRAGDWTVAPIPPTSRIAASRLPAPSTAR